MLGGKTMKSIFVLAILAIGAFVSASQADTCTTRCKQDPWGGDSVTCRTTCY
jgi:hypothetical protein